jgi:hypothetical protein
MDEAAAEEVRGSVEEGALGVAVVPAFGKDGRHGFLFGVVEGGDREETLREDVDRGEIDGVIVRCCLGRGGGTAGEKLSERLLLGDDLLELELVLACWGLVVAKSFMWIKHGFGGNVNGGAAG